MSTNARRLAANTPVFLHGDRCYCCSAPFGDVYKNTTACSSRPGSPWVLFPLCEDCSVALVRRNADLSALSKLIEKSIARQIESEGLRDLPSVPDATSLPCCGASLASIGAISLFFRSKRWTQAGAGICPQCAPSEATKTVEIEERQRMHIVVGSEFPPGHPVFPLGFYGENIESFCLHPTYPFHDTDGFTSIPDISLDLDGKDQSLAAGFLAICSVISSSGRSIFYFENDRLLNLIHLYSFLLDCEILTRRGEISGYDGREKPFSHHLLGDNEKLGAGRIMREAAHDDAKRLEEFFKCTYTTRMSAIADLIGAIPGVKKTP